MKAFPYMLLGRYIILFVLDPKNLSDGQPLLKPDTADLLYFCDICAGPGGFTDYLTWRRGWKCKGWGLTLKVKSRNLKFWEMEFSFFNACNIIDTRFTKNGPY